MLAARPAGGLTAPAAADAETPEVGSQVPGSAASIGTYAAVGKAQDEPRAWIARVYVSAELKLGLRIWRELPTS
jgi:hypothetical protein